jgi:hypothetical protein
MQDYGTEMLRQTPIEERAQSARNHAYLGCIIEGFALNAR